MNPQPHTRWLCVLAFAAPLLLATSPAWADTAFTMDFTSHDWDDARNTECHTETTSGGLDVTACARPGGNLLYQDNTDGLGIRDNPSTPGSTGYETDEIERPEELNVRFEEAVTITTISVTDFFSAETRSGQTYAERGCYQLYDTAGAPMGSPQCFTANNTSANGEQEIAINRSGVGGIGVWGLGRIGSQDHELSLAAVDGRVGVVPEPTTALLFAPGMAALAWFRRRRGQGDVRRRRGQGDVRRGRGRDDDGRDPRGAAPPTA